ncbi:MAG: polysaccharide biosynthesis tyrosine autokinase [Cyanobacteria bacterium P01_F01_bin.143]
MKFKSIDFNSLSKDLESEEATLIPEEKQANFVGTEVEVIGSIPLIEKTISELQLQNKQGELLSLKQFRKQLQIKQIDTTEIIEIAYRDPDQKIAAQVVNTLITKYIENNKSADLEELSSSKDIANNQLSKTKEDLEKVEKSIAQIKEKNQIIAPQAAAVDLTKTLEEISRKIIINRSEIANLQSRSRFLTDKLGMNSDKALVTVKVNQSLAVQNLIQQLQELELQLIKEKSNINQESSRIIDIQREIESKKELLQNQITQIAGNQDVVLFENSDLNIIQDLTLELVQLEANNIGLAEELDYLVKMEQEKSQKASLLPELELQLRQLERQLNTSQNAYQLLLEELNKIELAENQNNTNIRVISSEIRQKKKEAYYLGSLFLGLMAAIAAIVFLEISDQSFKTVEEAETFFNYSWLGIIPAFYPTGVTRSRQDSIANIDIPQLIAKVAPVSNIYESYQILYSNLKFICSQNRIKTIVMTSSISQEGKSSVAANLVYIMAQKEEKILLIDANLDSPIQYKIWDAYHNIGISNLIAERLSSQSVIQRVMPNLDVIAAGEINSTGTVILDSPIIQSFIDYYSNIYDLIIIDSPALDTNADAIALGKIADGTLLIVQSGQVTRSQAKFAKELLSKSGQNILGLVFNEFQSPIKSHNKKSRSTNDLLTNQERSLNLELSEASLWEIMSHHPREVRKLISNLDSEALDEISLAELEQNIAYFEQELEKLTQMVKEQEDEFFLQGQIVRKLQKQVNLANTTERTGLEQQLLQEQEVKDFLGETLLGQRRNLNQRKESLNQYREFLSTKIDSEAQLNGTNEH